jgi:hypothetical protein
MDRITRKPLKLPKVIKLGGQRITVKYDKKILEGKTGEAYGAYLAEKKEIHLIYGMKSGAKKSAFLHECLHAIADVYNVNLSEIQVASMELGLMDLVSNNKITL